MMFEVGDIIVYDSRAAYGPTVEIVGIVVSRTREEDRKGRIDWMYKMQFWKDGRYYEPFYVTERIAQTMSFPRIGHISSFDYGEPMLSAYTEQESNYVGTITL